MTTAQAVSQFTVEQDKYGSNYFTDNEIIGFINKATYEWLNRLVPDNHGGVVNFEFDSNTAFNIKPLVFTFTDNMDVDGVVTTSSLDTALQTESGDATASVFRVMSIGVTVSGQTYPVKFVRQNNLWSNNRNFFKRPSTTNTKVTYVAEGLKFYPVSQTNDLTITVIKTPKALALTPSVVNPELPDYAMNNIISIAVKLAAVATRDEEYLIDSRNSGTQITQ